MSIRKFKQRLDVRTNSRRWDTRASTVSLWGIFSLTFLIPASKSKVRCNTAAVSLYFCIGFCKRLRWYPVTLATWYLLVRDSAHLPWLQWVLTSLRKHERGLNKHNKSYGVKLGEYLAPVWVICVSWPRLACLHDGIGHWEIVERSLEYR